jgi:hypothetical protein
VLWTRREGKTFNLQQRTHCNQARQATNAVHDTQHPPSQKPNIQKKQRRSATNQSRQLQELVKVKNGQATLPPLPLPTHYTHTAHTTQLHLTLPSPVLPFMFAFDVCRCLQIKLCQHYRWHKRSVRTNTHTRHAYPTRNSAPWVAKPAYYDLQDKRMCI